MLMFTVFCRAESNSQIHLYQFHSPPLLKDMNKYHVLGSRNCLQCIRKWKLDYLLGLEEQNIITALKGCHLSPIVLESSLNSLNACKYLMILKYPNNNELFYPQSTYVCHVKEIDGKGPKDVR